METVYHFIRFQESIETNKIGNTARLKELISPLDAICTELEGLELESCSYPHRPTLEDVQATSTYLVGTCWVQNSVNLAAGKRTTDVGYFDEYTNQTLIDRLESLYGKENMYLSQATHKTKE